MAVIAYLVNTVAELYTLVIFVTVVLSWLISFNVINVQNQFVRAIWQACKALTEPLLRPIRSIMPNLGGLDLSPIVLLIAIQAAQIGLNTYVFGPLLSAGL